jgi:hypothetical protein
VNAPVGNPNFFILGAPKCGTTSLAAWLREHPRVFMPERKELHFFNTDHQSNMSSPKAYYESLFAPAGEEHIAVGEASVWYLYSTDAVPNIENTYPQSRYIVCLRNPVDMAYSLHNQMLVNGNESVKEFEEAWLLSSERLAGRRLPRFSREPSHLAYDKVCSLGAQYERLLSRVDVNRVLPVIMEDVKADSRSQYLRVIEFLGLDDDGRSDFPVFNRARARRSVLLRRMVMTVGDVKRSLGIRSGFGLLNKIDRTNVRYRRRPPLPGDIRQQLQQYFRDDVAKLGQLLGRDLIELWEFA